MAGARSYDDPCGIARALDRVGERWALLVIRELLLGPKRFTDLRGGLPLASPNVLSQRLRELEDHGVIRKRELPPPGKATVYELTRWGSELEPVVLALARWGSRATPLPQGPMSTDSLMLALKVTYVPEAHGEGDRCIEVRVGSNRYWFETSSAGLEVSKEASLSTDATITAQLDSLRRVVFQGADIAAAEAEGGLRIEGDEDAAVRFLGAFRRPFPADLEQE